MIFLWILLYLVIATAVVFLATKLSKYVDMLDKKTNLSGALLGGVLLAAVTSIPELFTSISAIFILPGAESSAMVIGNILGSDLFNAFVLAVTFIIFYKKFRDVKIDKGHISTTVTLIIFYLLIAYATLMPDSWQLRIGGAVNVVSVILFVGYLISVKLINVNNTVESEEDAKESGEEVITLTVKQIVLRFIALAVLLVGFSIAITYVTDIIADTLSLGKTFAGALFLGVATSLPEVSATIALCKLGNINAAIGNIVGSNTFNFIILVLADIVSWVNPVYCFDKQSLLLLIFGLISAISMCAVILCRIFVKDPESEKAKKLEKVLFMVGFFVVVACYISFLILSNV